MVPYVSSSPIVLGRDPLFAKNLHIPGAFHLGDLVEEPCATSSFFSALLVFSYRGGACAGGEGGHMIAKKNLILGAEMW
jgi:hypothetical protein